MSSRETDTWVNIAPNYYSGRIWDGWFLVSDTTWTRPLQERTPHSKKCHGFSTTREILRTHLHRKWAFAKTHWAEFHSLLHRCHRSCKWNCRCSSVGLLISHVSELRFKTFWVELMLADFSSALFVRIILDWEFLILVLFLGDIFSLWSSRVSACAKWAVLYSSNTSICVTPKVHSQMHVHSLNPPSSASSRPPRDEAGDTVTDSAPVLRVRQELCKSVTCNNSQTQVQ